MRNKKSVEPLLHNHDTERTAFANQRTVKQLKFFEEEYEACLLTVILMMLIASLFFLVFCFSLFSLALEYVKTP